MGNNILKKSYFKFKYWINIKYMNQVYQKIECMVIIIVYLMNNTKIMGGGKINKNINNTEKFYEKCKVNITDLINNRNIV